MKAIHTITVKRKTGLNGYGEGTYSGEETIKGRWNDEIKEFVDEKGAQLVSTGTIFYQPPNSLAVGDLVKKDGEFSAIRAIARYDNSTGSKTVFIAYLTPNAR